MARRHVSLLAAPLLLAAAAPDARPMAVFGVEIGQPIQIPECAHSRLSNGRVSEFSYDLNPAETCRDPDIQLRDAPWRRGWIVFPSQRSPLILSGNMLAYFVLDGIVVGLRAETLDHNNTDAIMRELVGKFGRPTSFESDSEVLQGIPVPARTAVWRLGQLVVRYRNVDQDIRHGSLLVVTPRFEQLRVSREREQLQARTPL